MENQIRSLIINPVIHIVAVSIVGFSGLFHMALGAAYADSGSPFQPTALASLYASSGGVKSQAAFMIIGGLFIMFSCAFLLWNLRKNRQNRTISLIAWIICILVVLFDFTGAIIAAQIYTPAAQYVKSNNLGLDSYHNRKHMYGFALANTIITFILAFPSVFYLFLATTYHRDKIQNQQNPEGQLQNQQTTVNNNAVQMTNHQNDPTSPQYKASPPKSIDLQRQHAYHMGQTQRRQGSVMYKQYNSSQIQKQQTQQPRLPQFNTSANPQIGSAANIPSIASSSKGQLQRSKTQFAHSQPDFNVNLTISGRRSIDSKMLKQQSDKPQ